MVVSTAPYSPPSAGEIVVKTLAVAINPADMVIQARGILLAEESYPAILGCDIAGEVVEVGESLAGKYRVGDRVIAQTGPLSTKDGVFAYSAFQEYVVLKSPRIAKIPDKITNTDAVVLPLGVLTAGTCLFAKETLGLSMPHHGNDRKESLGTLLIWGASSSVGSCGVQLATRAGYEVVGIASKRNHEMVKSLGAKACFDYNDPTLADDVVDALGDNGSQVVGAYDAISTDPTLNCLCEILDRCGGRKKVAAVMPGAEEKATRGVEIATNLVPAVLESDVPEKIFQWLESALQNDRIKCMPPADTVGNGLRDVQKAVDLMAQGISAKKLVVLM